MLLHFNYKQVKELAMHSLASHEHKPLTLDPNSNRPGLILAADDGVYFTSNGRPPLFVDPDDPAGPTHKCAYALECDPTKDKEESRRNKEASFGGSDGAEFIPYESDNGLCIKAWLEGNEGNATLAMELTETQIGLLGSELRPVLEGAVQKNAGEEFATAFKEGIRWTAWGVPVVAMDRRGLIAYLGALKQKNTELMRRLELASETNKALSALLNSANAKSQNGSRSKANVRDNSRKSGSPDRPARSRTGRSKAEKGAADPAPEQLRA